MRTLTKLHVAFQQKGNVMGTLLSLSVLLCLSSITPL